MEKARSRAVLMTEGPIGKGIVRFALPIMWGNLFQQLYNIVDSLVVGNFVGRDALAAVSSSGSMIFLLTGFFNGVFTGAGVVIARYFGAREPGKVQKAVHTAVAMGLAFGFALTVLGSIFTPHILRLINTPESVLPNSIIYFRIYFYGILSVIMYNTANGIYQAVGDSRHPLYYLITSSVLNVVLDLLFVAVFKWGIAGAAYATLIAQSLSALLAFRRLMLVNAVYRVRIKKLHFDMPMLKEILKMGIPSGVQNSVIAVANIFVQSNINVFGANAVAGCGSYSKIEGFVFIPIDSIGLSMATFIGQNLGAKEYDRAKRGARFGIVTAITLASFIGVAFYALAPKLIGLFNPDENVIAFGVSQARTITLFYGLLAFSHCVAGIMRGAGKSIVPMVVMLSSWCVFRVSYLAVITRIFAEKIVVVFTVYPVTWALSSVIFLIYFLKADWVHGFEKGQAL